MSARSEILREKKKKEKTAHKSSFFKPEDIKWNYTAFSAK
jgi:hypothetical protein